MIADASRYQPRSDDTALDCTPPVGTSVLPARATSDGKAEAKSAVQMVERWIMARLRR